MTKKEAKYKALKLLSEMSLVITDSLDGYNDKDMAILVKAVDDLCKSLLLKANKIKEK